MCCLDVNQILIHINRRRRQAILSQFSQKTKASSDSSENAEDDASFSALEGEDAHESGNNNDEQRDDEDEDRDDIDPSVEASDAAIIEEVAAEAGEHVDAPALTRADINLGRFAVTKVEAFFLPPVATSNIVTCSQLRNLAKHIFHSPTIRADLEIACGRTKTRPLMMVRDVATRWNSTAELIERALLLREALNLLVNFEQHNKPRSSRLKRFQLAKQEWELLEKLFPMLEVTI